MPDPLFPCVAAPTKRRGESAVAWVAEACAEVAGRGDSLLRFCLADDDARLMKHVGRWRDRGERIWLHELDPFAMGVGASHADVERLSFMLEDVDFLKRPALCPPDVRADREVQIRARFEMGARCLTFSEEAAELVLRTWRPDRDSVHRVSPGCALEPVGRPKNDLGALVLTDPLHRAAEYQLLRALAAAPKARITLGVDDLPAAKHRLADCLDEFDVVDRLTLAVARSPRDWRNLAARSAFVLDARVCRGWSGVVDAAQTAGRPVVPVDPAFMDDAFAELEWDKSTTSSAVGQAGPTWAQAIAAWFS